MGQRLVGQGKLCKRSGGILRNDGGLGEPLRERGEFRNKLGSRGACRLREWCEV
jgi:hypothetical protein